MIDGLDPVRFELFKNAIFSIADEMALTIVRTSYSGVIKDNMDFSTAFCDADGRLVAQGLTLPGHLGAVPTALAAVLKRYGDAMEPGDIFALNDPFEGGMHLPDIFIFKPIFVGGRVPGSNASDSTEIYQEGLRIPPLRLYQAGRPNETLFAMIERNVRLPAHQLGSTARRQPGILMDVHSVPLGH